MITEESRQLTLEVIRLREAGELTWDQIGARVGLTNSAARNRYQHHQKKVAKQAADSPEPEVVIEGIMPGDGERDAEEILSLVIAKQKRVFAYEQARQRQRIKIPSPSGVAQLSDFHLGNDGTDYEALAQDVKIIRDTSGLYCGFTGDGVDNWIVGKLVALQRNQALDFDSEWLLFEWILKELDESMLWVVAGNHDNWTMKIAGIDRLEHLLKGTYKLYHPQQIVFNLEVGPQTHTVKVRHKWRGNSIFNPTHGIEVGWERGGTDFDIGIGAHTHIATLYRQNIKHGKVIHTILTGTYKLYDEYGEEVGYAPSHGRGSTALIFDKNGNIQFFNELEQAADYLTYLRKRAKQ